MTVPYNQFHPNALPHNLQLPQNYVQVPRNNLMASVNHPYISSYKTKPLSQYPIIYKGVVQSHHIPPNSFIHQPIIHNPIRKHPQ